MASIASLYRYPLKGFSAEPLDSIDLTPGETVPGDRIFAIENGPGRFDTANPRHLPKINFLMLMRNERVATLASSLDLATQVLTINRAGKQVARGDLGTALGRKLVEQFLAAYFKADLRGAPKIVSAPGHSFSDVAAKCLHIVNLSSLAELERATGKAVDPLRFRANVYLAGVPPFAEIGWVGKRLKLGAVDADVLDRTVRCEATNVDPGSAQRDMAIPSVLQRTWGRTDFGIYATIASAGNISVGDTVVPPTD